MTTIDPHKAFGLATAGIAVVGHTIADHATGTAWYQRVDPWQDDLSELPDIELSNIDVTDDELSHWDDINGIDIDGHDDDENVLIVDMPDVLANLLYAIHADDDES